MRHVSSSDRLYIYQGNISKDWEYRPLGVRPVKLPQQEIAVVIRLYALGEVSDVVELFESIQQEWSGFGVTVNELQIDYDSPSSELSNYAKWLVKLNHHLGNDLSVTSLSAYVRENPSGLVEVANAVSYIAMQLYQGFEPHTNYIDIADRTAQLKVPYKLGITHSKNFENASKLCKEQCTGTIVFLNIKDQ